MKCNTKRIVQKCTADHGMERVPFHDREMEISIQYHVNQIRQSNDQILMRCYIINNVQHYFFLLIFPNIQDFCYAHIFFGKRFAEKHFL